MVNDVGIEEGGEIGDDVVYQGGNRIVYNGFVVFGVRVLSVGFLYLLLGRPEYYGAPLSAGLMMISLSCRREAKAFLSCVLRLGVVGWVRWGSCVRILSQSWLEKIRRLGLTGRGGFQELGLRNGGCGVWEWEWRKW